MQDLGVMNGNLPTGDDVAEYGYVAMKKHKVVAVHGLRTKLNAYVAPKLLPRAIMRQISGKFQSAE